MQREWRVHPKGNNCPPNDVRVRMPASSRSRRPDAEARSAMPATLFYDTPGSIRSRTRVVRTSMAKGLVIICMPGLRKPLAMAAFSA